LIVERVDLSGFGNLCGRSFCFSSALNVIVGLNEAGKTTLLEAIQALLYGQFSDSRAWVGETAVGRFRPWSGAEYGGAIYLRLANGDRFRIERNFDRERTTVFQGLRADDVTATYGPADHGWVEFADRHLGLTPAVFRACAYIYQNELASDADDVKLLHARLRTLADTGGTELSVQDALNALDAHRRNLDSLVEQAKETVRDCQVRLQRSRDAINSLASLVAERQRCNEAEVGILSSVEAVDRLVAWHEVKQLESQLPDLADVEARMAALLADVQRDLSNPIGQTVPHDEDDRARLARALTVLTAELDRLSPPTPAPAAKVAAARSAVEQWKCSADQMSELTARLSSIQLRRNLSIENLDSRVSRLTRVSVDQLRQAVRGAVDAQDNLDAALQKCAENPAESDLRGARNSLQSQLKGLSSDEIARMRALESEQTLPPAQPDSETKPLTRPTAAICGVLGLGAGYGLFTVVDTAVGMGGLRTGASALVSVGLGAVAYAVVTLVRSRHVPVTPLTTDILLSSWLAEYGASSVDELRRSWEHLSQLEQGIALARSLQQAVVSERRALASSLDELDRVAGTRDVESAKSSLPLLEAWHDGHSVIDQSEVEARDAIERARSELDTIEKAARAALQRLGISSDNPIQALSILTGLEADRERRLALIQRHAALKVDVDRYVTTIKALNERRPHAARARGGDTRSLADLRLETQRLHVALEDVRAQAAQVVNRREKLVRDGLAAPAEIEEDLAAATESLSRLDYRAKVLEEARSVIKASAEEHRRNFVPRLAEGVNGWLDRATNHRYARAEVSKADLSVELDSRDRGGRVPLDLVSRGTRDVVALLFRANIVDLLSTTGEPVPLFFDDPLVNVDPERSQNIVAVLGDLAQSRQIFYCTHDPRIVEWFSQRVESCVINLG
jgi:DNA repair exonuclease SbcCD ATPase subunit